MKTTQRFRSALSLLALLILVFGTLAYARISVSTSGLSNGVAVISNANTRRINKTVSVKAAGGSIKDARARGRYTSRKVTLGNRVIAKDSIPGDPLPTHVDANSVFFGRAIFIADKKGATVPDFTVSMKVHGSLKCKSPDLFLPPGQAVAAVAVDVVVDGASLFAGTAEQDATGPLLSTGDLTGQFTVEPNAAKISKTFPIQFGTLTDGQKLRVLFVGSTLVSFAPDVPLDYARANFYRTSSFSPVKGQQGKIQLQAAKKKVNVAYVTVNPVPPTYALYMESADTSIINDVDSSTVQVVAPTFGNFSGVPTVFDAIVGPPGDLDTDGTPDVQLTFADPATDSYLLASNTLIVTGATNAGELFYGILIRSQP